MPRSFCVKRPFKAGSAYTARKEKRARGCLYSGTCGALLRSIVRSSRRVVSFLIYGQWILREPSNNPNQVCSWCSSVVGGEPSSKSESRWNEPILTKVRIRNGTVYSSQQNSMIQRTGLTVSRDKEAFLGIGVASSMVPVLKYLTAEVTITHYISLACLNLKYSMVQCISCTLNLHKLILNAMLLNSALTFFRLFSPPPVQLLLNTPLLLLELIFLVD